MNIDDIVYVICLLACIGIGNYIKQIADDSKRKNVATIIGVVVTTIVSGFHGLHCFLSATLGAAAILYTHPSVCHLVTLGVMFTYLVFFRFIHLFGISEPPGHTNMIQMILTLKVAGVAFEKTAAWKKIQAHKKEKNENSTSDIDLTDYDIEIQNISFIDLFHYFFCYIGVLTGPYYRYRTYRDYFETPFRNYAPCTAATIDKLKSAVFYCSLYLLANYFWPLDYALSDEFYEQRSAFYRLMYVWPTFFIFRMRIYTGLTLSECVCIMAGFGAYPTQTDVRNGEGPRHPYMQLKSDAKNLEYNFTTIINTRVYETETCWTFREGMKHWNICVQYWLAVNIYKLFPIKKYRTAATLMCSAYWHGFRPGHYFCLMGAPFYVPMEDMWDKLVRQNATTLKPLINIIFWIAKFFTFSYLGTAFLLVSFSNIWRFYSSVYHIGYIAWAIMFALGMYLTKQKNKAARKKAAAANTNLLKEKAQ